MCEKEGPLSILPAGLCQICPIAFRDLVLSHVHDLGNKGSRIALFAQILNALLSLNDNVPLFCFLGHYSQTSSNFIHEFAKFTHNVNLLEVLFIKGLVKYVKKKDRCRSFQQVHIRSTKVVIANNANAAVQNSCLATFSSLENSFPIVQSMIAVIVHAILKIIIFSPPLMGLSNL